jgi:hypothetical protein
MDGTRQCALERPQRYRPPEQAQPRPDHEEHDGCHHHPAAERGVADMVSLYETGKRQLHADILQESPSIVVSNFACDQAQANFETKTTLGINKLLMSFGSEISPVSDLRCQANFENPGHRLQ